jgi:hypothetical protein
MKILFSLLLLANAALLFWVELLYGKRLLPALGGAPSVWNTCLMFYQVILLAGYAYALAVNRLALRGQVLVHGAVLGLTVAALPWALFVWPDPGGRDPILWLLALLTLSVGPPLFVLAAGAPLLQRWFSLSRHPDRHAHHLPARFGDLSGYRFPLRNVAASPARAGVSQRARADRS